MLSTNIYRSRFPNNVIDDQRVYRIRRHRYAPSGDSCDGRPASLPVALDNRQHARPPLHCKNFDRLQHGDADILAPFSRRRPYPGKTKHTPLFQQAGKTSSAAWMPVDELSAQTNKPAARLAIGESHRDPSRPAGRLPPLGINRLR